MVKYMEITLSCKSCRHRSRCPDRSRRYPCKDYERRVLSTQQVQPISHRLKRKRGVTYADHGNENR